MHIDRDLKLDFKDVLIRPKRSALPSRAEVDIHREYTFRHSKRRYRGMPIIAANMDTVGTFEMARALAPFAPFRGAAQALPRSTSWPVLRVAQGEVERVLLDGHHQRDDREIRPRGGEAPATAIEYVCIDVANGYTENFVKFVEQFRAEPIPRSPSWPATSSPAR